MKKTLYIILIISLLFACKKEREFNLPADLMNLTNGSLNQWLRTAPFTGVWDPKENSEGNIVITNIEQVFPFLGKFKNKADDFNYRNVGEEYIYYDKTLIFKDQQWGESAVYAHFLYESQDIYIEQNYLSYGNPFFGGLDAVTQTNFATMEETKAYYNKPEYIVGIYWASIDYRSYILLFYRNKNLTFECTFPCEKVDADKAIGKIKEINTSMHLKIAELSNITKEDLEVNENPTSFLDDPETLENDSFIDDIE